MDSQQLIIKQDGFVSTIIINKPEKRNTLGPSLLQQLVEVIKKMTSEGATRAIVITGAGDKAFSAGYDISEIPASGTATSSSDGNRILDEAFAAVRECEVPVIAMINGYCIGAGLDLAVNCDFRISHNKARFGITPAKLGIVYFHTGIQRFINLVGVSATKYLFYTGKIIDSDLARQFGLVDFVVDEQELENFTYTLAREIAEESAPLSVRGMKYIINSLTNKVHLSKEEEKKAIDYIIRAFSSKDMAEGQMAFLQKRKPDFKGE